MPKLRLLVTAVAALALSACGEGEEEGSPTMRPGQDCSGCHSEFTAAGTVYGSATAAADAGVPGVTVVIDGANASVTLTTNAAGNFFTTQAFGYPASVTVVGATAQMATALGSRADAGCAGCHDGSFRVHAP